ncbi:FGGY-family carbohydrate kinase [Paenibacillus humicola]|uniref:FGGY-family carbohydrate kinase n=1 Tax=Paenibacillus humicola TaxID=3110540 RepID=UPI00237A1587|nr:FGGY family carbohydrate kinase [Paenibacillus humicola]
MLLAIDIGTTNIKAGLFREDGTAVSQAQRPNAKTNGPEGTVVYDPQRLWETAAALIRDVTAAAGSPSVRAVGVTSMAESGLLLDPVSGEARSPIMPWFETCSAPHAEAVRDEIDAREHFCQTGLHASFKFGLPKLLWLRERESHAFRGAVWLSVSAYIAYRLTGRVAEDETLAARTFVYRIDSRGWNVPLIRHFGLAPELFPDVVPAGAVVGTAAAAGTETLGLNADTVVCLGGHDHICASLACMLVEGEAYNSMGTAETLAGTFPRRRLETADYESGLSFGLHPASDRMFWMGGHSSSGGSVEWLRETIGDGSLSYEGLMELLEATEPGPTGILYFPYLSGSDAPRLQPSAKAAFVGLTGKHGKGELLRAVLEGNAFQLELMRRSAQGVAGRPIEGLSVVGGGTRNRVWLQIKADVSGITLTVPDTAEAALLGAALAAGAGAGVFGSLREACHAVPRPGVRRIVPDPARHSRYARLYERGFLALLEPLTAYDNDRL